MKVDHRSSSRFIQKGKRSASGWLVVSMTGEAAKVATYLLVVLSLEASTTVFFSRVTFTPFTSSR